MTSHHNRIGLLATAVVFSLTLAVCSDRISSANSLISQFGAPLTVAEADSLLWNNLLAAEDARARSAEQLDVLVSALSSNSTSVRRIATRAVGRLERPDLVRHIEPLLSDSNADVRAEAANAVGQAVSVGGADSLTPVLLDRLHEERDSYVRGSIAQTLGRLPVESPETVRLVEATLVDVSADAEAATMVGIMRGLESWIRRYRRTRPPAGRTVERLYELTRYQSKGHEADAKRVRRLALTALGGGGFVDVTLLRRSLSSPDVELRRLAVESANTLLNGAQRDSIVSEALLDKSPAVRFAALQIRGRRIRGGVGCELVTPMSDDSDQHVALLAIDLLGDRCATQPGVADLLSAAVERLPSNHTESWHEAAHAMVGLAKVAPELAGEQTQRFSDHATWWIRMYAARAATILKNTEALTTLAYDSSDNVREAAISGLSLLAGHAADSVFVAQLSRPDYQLVITAAGALGGSPSGPVVVPVLVSALERITAERRETSRDARVALLDVLGELADRRQADYLASYLRDFDPAVAERAARILTTWTGQRWSAAPQRLELQQLPSYAQLRELVDIRAVIELEGGTTVELRLLPFESPTNTWRFARLARSGYFDGLTFHRVVPGFVIQGGSPGANEYVGDGPYTRDELVVQSHLRGTVGVSTRGRDTGDGQIFVNLVDNPRLDHNYTIFAEVVSGMDAVDRVLEGTVIERIVLR